MTPKKSLSLFHRIFEPFQLIFNYILRLDTWILSGEGSNNRDLSVIFMGRKEDKNYLAYLAFGDSSSERYLGKTWIWNIFKTAKKHGQECSLMVAETHTSLRKFFREKFFYVPCWIDGEVDISVDMGLLTKKKSMKNDLRKIKKNGLRFEITTEQSGFDDFYFNMYVPYAVKAHGNRAIIYGYDFMKKKFEDYELLLIKKGEESIAGGIIAHTKKGMRLWLLGVRDGNAEYVKEGAVSAKYYYSIIYLKEKGYGKINFGFSRAFLKDGVLRYKKKWGITLCKTYPMGFLIKPLAKTEGVKRFFLNNPFIYIRSDKYNGAVFIDKDQPLDKKDFIYIYRNHYLKGISSLSVYNFGRHGEIKQEVPSEFSGRITLNSADILFE